MLFELGKKPHLVSQRVALGRLLWLPLFTASAQQIDKPWLPRSAAQGQADVQPHLDGSACNPAFLL